MVSSAPAGGDTATVRTALSGSRAEPCLIELPCRRQIVDAKPDQLFAVAVLDGGDHLGVLGDGAIGKFGNAQAVGPDGMGLGIRILDRGKQISFGRLGAGAAAKVINNAVAHAVMVVVAEAGSLATDSGVSIPKLIQLLSDRQMGLHRPLTHRFAERVIEGNYDGGMPVDAATKDSQLALELAQSLKVPIFAIQASHTVYELACRSGHGRLDYAAIAKLWEAWGVPTVPGNEDQLGKG